MAEDKHQRLYICSMHGSLHTDEGFCFSFIQARQVHYTESCFVQYSYFQATKLPVFSIQLVWSHQKEILCIVVVGNFHLQGGFDIHT